MINISLFFLLKINNSH